MLRLNEPETLTTSLPRTETSVTESGVSEPAVEKWPDAVAYLEAIQNPADCLDDPALYGATVTMNRRGLPLAYTGRFAVVFRLAATDSTVWALRCFTSSPEGEAMRSLRYAALLPRLRDRRISDLFVPFRYLPDGIKVGRSVYPALVMGWAAGEPIGAWVEKHRNDPSALLTLAATLSDVLARLNAAGISHGDWQHDNLLVSENGRRVTLVDYDGMYVPELHGMPPAERGHPNYQNPNREGRDYGPELDHFSCLLIQTALVTLAVEPTLWDSFCDGDALVFHQQDLEDPARSDAFSTVRLIAEQERDLIPLLQELESACWAGAIPPAIPRTVFEKIAARRGLVLGRSEMRSEPLSASPVRTEEEPVVNAPLVTIGAETELAPVVTRGRQWFDAIRGALRRQKVREGIHRVSALSFYGGMTVLWIDPNLLPFLQSGADSFGFRFLSMFLLPAGTAVTYFLWPRNLDGIEVTEAIARTTDQLQVNYDELIRSRNSFHELNRNPANLSAVAFVAARLKTLSIEEFRNELRLTPEEWQFLNDRQIGSLADISTQSIAEMSGGAREQLKSVRQSAMQAARNDYEQVANTRRALRRESEELERERQGLQGVHDELNQRLSQMGEENLLQFFVSLFRFR
ncbi:MAG: serine/threonine-protein kinase [Capsulimonadales bacterium]|nr:serine/threonine-protein kinase [Capsulimonadales bacterium]